MDCLNARKIAAETAHLVELCVKFQASYGKGYRLNGDSPAEAWDLYRETIRRQRTIAGLLDADALESPLERLGRWWLTEDAIDIGLINELMREVTHLILVCAYHEAHPSPDGHWSPALNISQASIAGLLHPNARREPLREE